MSGSSVAQSEQHTALATLEHHQAAVERQAPPVVITSDQMELIKATIAKDATDAELQLFIYDNRRRGLHPLDRLLHFTKRAGKYTPVTSIDLFRARAATSRAHMGTDDVLFAGSPGDPDFAATVTVYRLVQGEKCPFTATARMSEYMPDPPNDFMWRKMPHGQLGKCAEALALRKGFPQELEGLHTFEEMEQASVLEHPKQADLKAPQRRSDAGRTSTAPSATTSADLTVEGVLEKCDKGKKFWSIRLKDDERFFTAFDDALGRAGAVLIGQRAILTFIEKKATDKTYYNVSAIAPAPQAAPPADQSAEREPGAEG